MMPAAKHGDPQLGVDIHLCTVPPGVPAPLPTPHMSVVFDPFDYIPFIGATITVMGMKRATAGTSGTVVHIPPGFPFAPKLPEKDDELFMGSATVVADGDPMAHISHPVLSCQVAGMLSPFRLRKKGGPRIGVLPTVFNLAIPSTVFVGGPPTINLMGVAMKGAFSALGKIAKSGVFKRIRQKLFKNMKPGFLKCVILRAEPVNILSGAVSVEQEDFTLPGRLPVEWLRSYSSSSAHVGVCGIGWETLLDIRLQVLPGDGAEGGGVLLHGPGVGPLSFAQLPLSLGEAGAELELSDGARLIDDGDGWQVRTKDDRIYHFPRRLAPQTGPDGTLTHPVARITDRCGNALEIEHRGGLPVAITEAAGRRLALQHDNGRLVAVALVDSASEAEHVFVRYQYDAAGDLVAVVDALGQPYRFAYERHHMVRHTDRNGLSFHYAFDTTGPEGWRVVHAWGDGGLYDYRFEYLDALSERRITDSLGHVSLVRLDERGLPVSEIDPLGGMTVYEYDDAGRTTAVVDPGGKRTEYAYDDHGNLLQLTRPDGAAVATRFDADDRPVQVTDPNGAVWQQQWDARGLLVAQTSPLGHASHYVYDGWGQLTAYTNPRGARTELRFDLVGNLAELRDALQHTTRFAHDHLGNVIAKADPLDRRTLYRYDAKGRLLGVKLPSGSTVACAYDAEDNLVRYTDENGAVTQLEYFGQGEIARRIQPDGHTVEYLYDTEEQLTGVRNQRGELYELRRDPLGRVIDEVDYWGQSRRYAYDASGHLQASIDPLGRRIDYRCDPLGRIVQKLLPATPGQPEPDTETFAYDANGNLVATANRHVAVTRAFDAEGQLLMELQQHAQGQSFQVSNAYDAAGNRIRRMTEHSAGPGHVVEFAFDLLDQPSGVRIDGGAPMRMHHDALGQLTEEELAPGLRRSARYDADGLLTEQTLSRTGGSAGGEGGAIGESQTLFSTRYSYDRAGNLTSRDDSAFGRDSYLYDPMGRILQHTDPQGMLHQFFNDPAGDRLVTRVEGRGSVSTVLGRNDDWHREGVYQGTRYRFDRAGNLTRKHDATQHLDLAWDANQRLIASRRTLPGGATPAVTTYAYDPLGRRLWKETAGQRTWFGWDGHTVALDVIRESPREFIFQPEDFIPFAIINASQHPVQRFVNDANGAPTRLLGAAGQILWSASYSISAAIAQRPVRTFDNPIRLQGQYEDDETGLHYNLQRYYCPTIASFISLDPLGIEAGENVFAYGPNTYGWVDPLGLAKCKRTPKTSPFKQWMAKKAKGGRDTHVYVLMKNKKVVYVGIAKNLNVRKAQHRKNKVFDKMVPLTTAPLHRGEARSIEQALIHNNPGFINEINSIAEKREIYGGAVNFGENWLAKNGHALTY